MYLYMEPPKRRTINRILLSILLMFCMPLAIAWFFMYLSEHYFLAMNDDYNNIHLNE